MIKDYERQIDLLKKAESIWYAFGQGFPQNTDWANYRHADHLKLKRQTDIIEQSNGKLFTMQQIIDSEQSANSHLAERNRYVAILVENAFSESSLAIWRVKWRASSLSLNKPDMRQRHHKTQTSFGIPREPKRHYKLKSVLLRRRTQSFGSASLSWRNSCRRNKSKGRLSRIANGSGKITSAWQIRLYNGKPFLVRVFGGYDVFLDGQTGSVIHDYV